MFSQLNDYTFAPIGRWLTLTFLPRVSLRLPWAKYFWPFRPCKWRSFVLAVQATKSIAGSASDEDDRQ